MKPQDISKATKEICSMAPVIPVIIVDDINDAAPLAESLVAGGLKVLEVTLRTDIALDVISKMAASEPNAVVGAGTLMNANDVKAAKEAGAQFGVSPGATDDILQAAIDYDLPILPGGVTASEVMNLLAKGFDMLKFFPAEAAGGTKMLKSFSSPLQAATFCPTGGVGVHNVKDYLSLPNVKCVGGSWVCDPKLVKSASWDEITKLSLEASTL